jgi:hypothetical protein
MRAASRSQPLAVLLALVPWVFSGIILLASLAWGLALRCDDSCGGDGWRRTEDAWQWNVLPVMGGIAFIAGTALFVCVCLGRPWGALAALLVGTVTALFGGSWLVPGWHEHLDRNIENVLVCVAVFFAGLFAALLASPRTREGA